MTRMHVDLNLMKDYANKKQSAMQSLGKIKSQKYVPSLKGMVSAKGYLRKDIKSFSGNRTRQSVISKGLSNG